ncbi:IS3 family transposase [Streptomyces sp. NPDC058625]|uniref:IS3 family transposase n=1 Tax=Streptomyces sp. NPDC058625 TaxID=3346564 RepID=UPI00365D175F
MTALLDEHSRLGVECVLRELHIPSSTYYRWRRAEREPCERQRRDAELTEQIKEIHAESGGVYGSPRVHAVLRREGTRVGRKRVERLMREAGIAGISPRRKGFTRRDPKATPAPDLVNRDFTASAPNRLWVTDLTMISTGRGQVAYGEVPYRVAGAVLGPGGLAEQAPHPERPCLSGVPPTRSVSSTRSSTGSCMRGSTPFRTARPAARSTWRSSSIPPATCAWTAPMPRSLTGRWPSMAWPAAAFGC